MARTKEFDPDSALRAAQELFRERGYEATSMADLVERLGIGRASVYATFGNKHDLYLKALDRYGREQDRRLVRELSQPGPTLPAVRAVVRRFATEASDGQLRELGCLVTNTAVELSARDAEANRRVLHSWDTVETLLHAALARARAQGELPADRDAAALARTLLVLLQGLRVVGRASPDPERVRCAAEQVLTLLD
jgi:TetR/AcrR family transcriptional repressor of nem operon